MQICEKRSTFWFVIVTNLTLSAYFFKGPLIVALFGGGGGCGGLLGSHITGQLSLRETKKKKSTGIHSRAVGFHQPHICSLVLRSSLG